MCLIMLFDYVTLVNIGIYLYRTYNTYSIS